jgi:hypothetical protein
MMMNFLFSSLGFNVLQLKELLRLLALPVTGTRAVMIERLLDVLKSKYSVIR